MLFSLSVSREAVAVKVKFRFFGSKVFTPVFFRKSYIVDNAVTASVKHVYSSLTSACGRAFLTVV